MIGYTPGLLARSAVESVVRTMNGAFWSAVSVSMGNVTLSVPAVIFHPAILKLPESRLYSSIHCGSFIADDEVLNGVYMISLITTFSSAFKRWLGCAASMPGIA